MKLKPENLYLNMIQVQKSLIDLKTLEFWLCFCS